MRPSLNIWTLSLRFGSRHRISNILPILFLTLIIAHSCLCLWLFILFILVHLNGVWLKSIFHTHETILSPSLPPINNRVYKEEKILKGSLDSTFTFSENSNYGGKVWFRWNGKTLLGIVNKLLKTNVCWHHPAKFCLITSSKLSHQ